MDEIFSKIFKITDIRNKIIFTALVIALYRFLAHVPVPGVDVTALKEFFASNQFLSFLNLFTGGGLSNLSIVALGVGPYINASIIIQLLTMVVPSLEELSKEGVFGRQKINQYTQALTLPLAIIQAYGIYYLLASQNLNGVAVLPAIGTFDLLVIVLSMVAGTFFLMWLGEAITEHGIGSGMSILIFAGILAGIPSGLAGFAVTFDSAQIFAAGLFIVVAATVIAGVVNINEAYRKIEVSYSSKIRSGLSYAGGLSYIPVKINQAGVIPIIFAVSIVLVPSALGSYLQRSVNSNLSEIGSWMVINFQSTSFYYNLTYFLLVCAFTYFYTSVTFNPEKVAEDIRRNGGFIPGIRPGKSTISYLKHIILRLNLAGGVFLGTIAVMPSILQSVTNVTALAIGGTSLLIVVSVILQTIKQVESQVITREYKVIAR